MVDLAEKRRLSFGIEGLDSILGGGLPEGSSCVLRGGPGTGKTTIGAHFLAAGLKLNERSLIITLGEDQAKFLNNAKQLGIDLTKADVLDLSPTSEELGLSDSSSLFSPSEMERDKITKLIVDKMTLVRPRRIFLDSSSHLRLLCVDATHFRKQLLGLIRYLLAHQTTLLITSQASAEVPDNETQHLCDAVIDLTMDHEWRYIEIKKLRSSAFRPGNHSLRLGKNGCTIYPILRPQEHVIDFTTRVQPSGIATIDRMLFGGIESGTTTLITGPSGVGKSTLSLQFAQAAAERGERAVFISFEETRKVLASRAASLGFNIDLNAPNDHFEIKSIEPLLVSADEIAHMVRREVEERGCSFFVIDSVAGFRLAVKSHNFVIDLRSLLKYLTNMGATVIIINEIANLTGDFSATEVGVSFLADNIIFLRYLEIRGEMRKAIGVLKKRLSDYERYLREFSITSKGVAVGEPLVGLRGILSGIPDWTSETALLPGPKH